MIDFPYLSDVVRSTPSRIVMVVVDGLGGMPHPDYGKSELEIADIPSLDALASTSSVGATIPVLPGITPGSGPGHMALFGYNPVKYLLGRGILEGMGIGADISLGDVAARGNFCVLDVEGSIVDRRAGRLDTETCIILCSKLNEIQLDGAEFHVYPVMDYRFVLVLKGRNISPNISETDPQTEGVIPLVSQPFSSEAQITADFIKEFVSKATELLGSSNSAANGVLLRGFSSLPTLPDFGNQYALNPAAIAAYPMYRGLAGMIGMDILDSGQTFESEIETLEANFNEGYDFFFLHYKPADSAGEDGDFLAKVHQLENFNRDIQRVIDLKPDVLVICGDHSTPSFTASHSWHPVPFMINSLYSEGSSAVFNEKSCRTGAIGTIQAEQLMLQVLAHASKLKKFGP